MPRRAWAGGLFPPRGKSDATPRSRASPPLCEARARLAECGIDVSHETVRFWWNRFGPMFAAEIRKRRAAHMRGFPHWRWHLDEAFVKVNGKLCYLWRAVDHEGEVLEAVVTAKRDSAAALKFEAPHEKIRSTASRGDRPAFFVSCCDAGDRQRRPSADRASAQQSGREFASAVSTARTGDATLSKQEDLAKVQLNSWPGSQPFQSGASSRQPPRIQTEALGRTDRMARPGGINVANVFDIPRRARLNYVSLTLPPRRLPQHDQRSQSCPPAQRGTKARCRQAPSKDGVDGSRCGGSQKGVTFHS